MSSRTSLRSCSENNHLIVLHVECRTINQAHELWKLEGEKVNEMQLDNAYIHTCVHAHTCIHGTCVYIHTEAQPPIHIYTYMHTHIHATIHIYTICIHPYKHTCKYIPIQTCTCTCMITCMHACAPAQTSLLVYAYTRIYTHAHRYVRMILTYMHVYVCTHTCMRAYLYTHIHTNT